MVDRAPHAAATPIQDVGVDHRRRDVAMAEQLLDGANVIAGFQEVRREGVP